MPEGPLFKAAIKGDVEASIAVIDATGQLQTLPRPPTRLSSQHQHIHTFTLRAHTPQQVRSLLASGIKPDAERNVVSVFWCRLD